MYIACVDAVKAVITVLSGILDDVQQQQQTLLCRQLHALAQSILKGCLLQGSSIEDSLLFGTMFTGLGVGGWVLGVGCWVFTGLEVAKAQVRQLPPNSRLAKARAVLVPWLVLLGRYLRVSGAYLGQLQHSAAAAVAAHAQSVAPSCSSRLAARTADAIVDRAASESYVVVGHIKDLLRSTPQLQAIWRVGSIDGLFSSSSSSSSSIAGRCREHSDLIEVWEHLDSAVELARLAEDVTDPLKDFWKSACGGGPSAALMAISKGQPAFQEGFLHSTEIRLLAQRMQQVGTALCNQLPVSWCCNNPECTNLGGASELQLVGGKGSVCGGCRVAR
jgi:hypothetical protein